MNQTPRKAGNWLNEEISSGKSFDATIVPLPAVPRNSKQRVFLNAGANGIHDRSRIRVRPSPSGISGGCQAGRWS